MTDGRELFDDASVAGRRDLRAAGGGRVARGRSVVGSSSDASKAGTAWDELDAFDDDNGRSSRWLFLLYRRRR